MVNNRSHEAPFYPLTLIQGLVSAGNFRVVNRRAEEHLERLGWTSATLKAFILALTEDDFDKRFPDQEVSGKFRINCDAYIMSFNEDALQADVDEGLEFYIKLAVNKYRSSLIVSFHLSGSPG